MAELQRFNLAGSGEAATPEALLAFLQSATGNPVEIDAADAAQADTLQLQILVSAARQWDAAGLPLGLINMGETFRAGVERLGIDPALLESEVTV